MDYYRNLRATNPDYLYFYDFGEYQIISASPRKSGVGQGPSGDN